MPILPNIWAFTFLTSTWLFKMYCLYLLNRWDLIYNNPQHRSPFTLESMSDSAERRLSRAGWETQTQRFLARVKLKVPVLLCWLFNTFWMSNSQKALQGDGDSSSLPQGRLPADYLLILSGFLCTPGSWIPEQLHPASYTMGHQGLVFLELGETNF